MDIGFERRRWVGVDWATESHAVCVVDSGGNRVEQFDIPNTPEGLCGLIGRLSGLARGEGGSVEISIEVPHGPVVDTLLDGGFTVFTINPKQVDRFRDRYSPTGAKDDRRDAFVLANALRTDPQAFHRIDPDRPAVVELREWSRIDQELRQELGAEANRVYAQLLRSAPHWLKLCPAANEPWFWAMLELAPTPQAASELTLAKVQAVLRAHRIRRLSGGEVLEAWQLAIAGTAEGVVAAVGARLSLLIPRLRLLHRQRRRAEQELNRCIDACRAVFAPRAGRPDDLEIALSLPGIGLRVTASFFGEAGRCLADRDLQSFRAQTGMAPITKASGKTRLVVMRRACNPRLRDACFHWARIAVQRDARAKTRYADLRAKGHSHARALRGVTDRLADRFFAMLDQGTLYDPNHRRVPPGQKAA